MRAAGEAQLPVYQSGRVPISTALEIIAKVEKVEDPSQELINAMRDGQVTSWGWIGRDGFELDAAMWGRLVASEFPADAARFRKKPPDSDPLKATEETWFKEIILDTIEMPPEFFKPPEDVRVTRIEVDRRAVERIWRRSDVGEKQPIPTAKVAFKADVDAEYVRRLEIWQGESQRFPTVEEDTAWARERGIARTRMRDLRRAHRPQSAKKGGAPKQTRPI
jgi:hypothetical protein